MATVAEYDAAIAQIAATGSFNMAFIDPTPAAPAPAAALTPVEQYDDAIAQIAATGTFNPDTFGTPGVDLAPVAASPWVDPVPDYYDAPYELQQQPIMASPDVFGG